MCNERTLHSGISTALSTGQLTSQKWTGIFQHLLKTITRCKRKYLSLQVNEQKFQTSLAGNTTLSCCLILEHSNLFITWQRPVRPKCPVGGTDIPSSSKLPTGFNYKFKTRSLTLPLKSTFVYIFCLY